MPPEEVQPLLAFAARRLKAAGCDTPDLDARLLLQAATGLSREDMILYPGRRLGAEALSRFMGFLERREGREPVSRILGMREFYGRRFRVTPDVLDPRPDTETLVEAALGVMAWDAMILDLGTGSGAIAITLLAERPEARGVATDVSPAALAVARENAVANGVSDRLDLREGSWFAPVSGLYDLIVSNPPYIPEADVAGLSPDVRNFDPRLALVGGTDGLDPYRALAHGVSPHLSAGGDVLVEIGAGQAPEVERIFSAAGLELRGRYGDLGGHVRCLRFGR